MIIFKSEPQIAVMRDASTIVAETLKLVEDNIRVGVTTLELNNIAEKYIRSRGGTPSFLGYKDYPASITTSINEVVVHGIPSASRRLKEGDIIGIDIGVFYNGFHGDAARTFAVGKISPDDEKLMRITRESFFEGIKYARPGYHLNHVCVAIQKHIESNGFSVIKDLIGHGVGKDLHEDPNIPNYDMKRRGPKLLPGMVLAIEPMVSVGSDQIEILEDDWTAVTADRSKSSHYENTIVITNGDPEILTLKDYLP